MKHATPIDDVVGILRQAGYRTVPVPLSIRGVSVEFNLDAALVGKAGLSDLVVVVDTATQAFKRIREKVEALARALDISGSRRPLTCVVVGPRPDSDVLNALSQVCRVLPIGNTSAVDYQEHLREWLSVLLPLTIPGHTQQADPMDEFKTELGANRELFTSALVNSAKAGASAVEEEAIRLLSLPFASHQRRAAK